MKSLTTLTTPDDTVAVLLLPGYGFCGLTLLTLSDPTKLNKIEKYHYNLKNFL